MLVKEPFQEEVGTLTFELLLDLGYFKLVSLAESFKLEKYIFYHVLKHTCFF